MNDVLQHKEAVIILKSIRKYYTYITVCRTYCGCLMFCLRYILIAFECTTDGDKWCCLIFTTGSSGANIIIIGRFMSWLDLSPSLLIESWIYFSAQSQRSMFAKAVEQNYHNCSEVLLKWPNSELSIDAKLNYIVMSHYIGSQRKSLTSFCCDAMMLWSNWMLCCIAPWQNAKKVLTNLTFLKDIQEISSLFHTNFPKTNY